MSDAWGAIGIFALGGVGWLVTSFVGPPYRQFFDLRGEAIHKSMLYGNVFAFEKESADGNVEQVELSEAELKRLFEARDKFRDLAARMRAFALNERFAAWFVNWRYDPWEASEALLRVSNTLQTYGMSRFESKQTLEKALRFRITKRPPNPQLTVHAYAQRYGNMIKSRYDTLRQKIAQVTIQRED